MKNLRPPAACRLSGCSRPTWLSQQLSPRRPIPVRGQAITQEGSTCTVTFNAEDGEWIFECIDTSEPQLAVSPTSLDFGQIIVNRSKDLSFTVSNSRGGTLTGTVSGSDFCTIVSGGSFSLAGGASQSVGVRCKPTSTGSFTHFLVVLTTTVGIRVTEEWALRRYLDMELLVVQRQIQSGVSQFTQLSRR
jgi:hypothetical protein